MHPARTSWLVACALALPLTAQAPSKELAEVAAAYAAKVTASALFVSGRTLESVRAQELAPTRPIERLIAPLLRFDVDREAGTVTCRLGVAKATAVHKGPLGCSLARPDADVAAQREMGLRATAALRRAGSAATPPPADAPWPRGERLPAGDPDGVDVDALRAAVDRAFAEPHADRKVHTRAVVVVHRGRLVAERYADGVDRDTPLPGWSMTKTLTNALVGRRWLEGFVRLDTPYLRKGPGGPMWTPEHLLTMTAGLEWNESYEDPNGDALRMLFASSDHAAAYGRKPQLHRAGERFRYASGATNLLCALLRRSFDERGGDDAYWASAERLFAQLGMRTAVLETDPSGTFVGSSYAFASARDWARLGMLYLDDGVVDGRRLLPEGWVQRSVTPHAASRGRYGMQVWLNADPDGDGPEQRYWPELPADLFYMSGHEGQYVVMAPSADLVVVRLGCTKNGGFDLAGLVRDAHAAVGAPR